MPVTNPYRNRGPLRRRDEFFGRRRELEEIYRAVMHGHYVSLVGERRVGKTSILYALSFEEFRLEHGVPE
jgi:AAA+ ATPase superfamily predicted ATPase